MSELSSAAQAVLDAAYQRMDENPHNEVEATLAAALRAAADQVVPTTVDPRLSTVRSDLMRIATELEAQ
jgi:predicted negative regulator of RcsB-dependent stress response